VRVLVTGARGKVGRATVAALMESGHDVRASDLFPPVFERPAEGEPHYFQANLTDAGDAFAAVRGAEAVVHTAAIPEPTRNPPHVVFHNNLMATFNALEAAIRFGVPRFVNISSETVPGEGNYERNLGPQVRDASVLSPGFWSYIDVYDLADAIVLAVESDLAGHEVFYIASPDNVGGRPFEKIVREYYGDAVEIKTPLPREDASGISIAKAQEMLGYSPRRSWRDYLDEEGHLKPGVRGLFS
jgi:nucleoside-diphosphate-sugar epimerase